METEILQIGSKLMIELPANLVKSLDLYAGKKVKIANSQNAIEISYFDNENNLEDILLKVNENNVHYEIDSGSSQGLEQW